MGTRKQYLAAITARVINGLPAPLGVDLCYGGDPDFLGIKLDTIAEAKEWLALDPKAYVYDYKYEPSERYPHGHRIVGGQIPFLDVKLHITAWEGLPGPLVGDDAAVMCSAHNVLGCEECTPGVVVLPQRCGQCGEVDPLNLHLLGCDDTPGGE